MSFFRVTEPNVGPIDIVDLGITIAQNTTVVLSDQFSVNDLYLSADLEALIINGDLTVEIDYGTGFASILAIDYTNRDCLSAFLNVYEITNENNNEDLVDGSDASVSNLHSHDSRYFTKPQLQSATTPSGASLIGFDDTALIYAGAANNVQDAITNLNNAIAGFDLDDVYTNDVDGIMDIDDVSKSLNFRSDNANDVIISRTDTVNSQEALLFDVSANELILGDLAAGALAEIDVRVRADLIVDGDITFTGTITDTTVNELNVTNANINLRDGAVTDANASITVDRPVGGTNASLLWDETDDRWKAGLEGSENTIALLELDELVTGVWEFQGGATTEPSMYLTDKTVAPTTNLGTATQIPMSMVNNVLGFYDKTRTKWLSVHRDNIVYSGRDNANNANEYARIGEFTSNQAGFRLLKNMTLVGATVQCRTAGTCTIEVRKNGVATVESSVSLVASDVASDATLDVDFTAGDEIQVYINGTSIDRPLISLIFAETL
jgi:hypothetical protein